MAGRDSTRWHRFRCQGSGAFGPCQRLDLHARVFSCECNEVKQVRAQKKSAKVPLIFPDLRALRIGW
eukprot:6552946-Lingulodinium_polyedra.AAC.1